MAPLGIAVGIELISDFQHRWKYFKRTGYFPPSDEGSPVGNKIAVVLGILFILIFVLPIVWVMVSGSST